MVITKILETTLSVGATSVVFTDSNIPNSLLLLNSTDPDLMPVSRSISGNSLTINYEPQSSAKGIALYIVKEGFEVINNLTSDSQTDALSAAQGKALKNLIDSFSIPSVEELTDVEVEDLQSDDILIYDALENKWINSSLPSVPENINDLTDVNISSPVDGQILTYDDGEWKNANAPDTLVNYVATETVIGTYLGETLYRQIITGLNVSLNTNAWTTLPDVVITNGKDLVNCVCYGTYTEQYIINCTKVHLNSADGAIEVRNIESSTTLTAIMLEYTKKSV